ncbi:MAG: 16S rRNA (guanine(527)-N(7))-methyltransferase RsmG [Bacteroidales bacterium]|nr:16S rRNA (guanine(527)-N(7))-methyltransferase RsmG [Bacteroidales bacterium]
MNDILRYFPDLTEQQKERFAALEPLYREWNAQINVISRKDMDSFYLHHVLHSLAIAKVADKVLSHPGTRVLDLGTGGGFPGIPLAIMYPEARFVLCDSVGKKIKVAGAVAEALGLENVECVNDRAENLQQEFDWVVSRAVTSLDKFIPWVKGRFTKGILYLKGGDVDAELNVAAQRRLLDLGKTMVTDIDIFFQDSWFAEKKVVLISK